MMVAGCAGAQVSETEPITLTPAQFQAVQAGVRGRLKDPDSAQFGAYKAVRSLDAKGDVPRGSILVCGKVNAKNSYGGYTGELPYGGVLSDHGIAQFTPFGIASAQKSGDIGVFLICKRNGINTDLI